jgi:hypothetical protein
LLSGSGWLEVAGGELLDYVHVAALPLYRCPGLRVSQSTTGSSGVNVFTKRIWEEAKNYAKSVE